MAKQGESVLSREIIDAIEARDWNACLIKIQPGRYMSRGCPDILGVIEGRMVALEVKMPGKESTLSDHQVKWLDKFREGGAISAMVTSVDQALELIERNL